MYVFTFCICLILPWGKTKNFCSVLVTNFMVGNLYNTKGYLLWCFYVLFLTKLCLYIFGAKLPLYVAQNEKSIFLVLEVFNIFLGKFYELSIFSVFLVLSPTNIFVSFSWSSQDSSVGDALDWYFEGPGLKSCCLQLNCQLEKGCRRDSMQYAIKYSCLESNLKEWYGIFNPNIACIMIDKGH